MASQFVRAINDEKVTLIFSGIYLISSNKHEDGFIIYGFKGACAEAERICRQFNCTTYVYRVRFVIGRPTLIQEAQYTPDEFPGQVIVEAYTKTLPGE